MLIAIGPDGGWDEPFEPALFRSHGFEQAGLAGGLGTLRTDVALTTLVARAYERLEDEDRAAAQAPGGAAGGGVT